MSLDMNEDHISVFVTPFNTYQIESDVMIRMNPDRRTKEGKIRDRYEKALFAIDEIAWELDIDIFDILPIKEMKK